jgi:hypothetical protein
MMMMMMIIIIIIILLVCHLSSPRVSYKVSASEKKITIIIVT